MDIIVIIAFVGFYIGLSKGGIGGPIAGAVILPALSQIMTVQQAVGITLPLLMVGDVFAMRAYWGKWDWRYVMLLIPSAIIGILIGTLMLANLSDIVLRRILGILTLVIVVYKLVSDSLSQFTYVDRPWHGYVAGLTSGIGSALANSGGPPLTAYLLLQRVKPATFVATITLFFTIVNILKIPGYLIAGIIDVNGLLEILWTIPLIPLGVWVGYKTVNWINPRVFEWLMLSLLLIAALILLFSTPSNLDSEQDTTAMMPASIITVTHYDYSPLR